MRDLGRRSAVRLAVALAAAGLLVSPASGNPFEGAERNDAASIRHRYFSDCAWRPAAVEEVTAKPALSAAEAACLSVVNIVCDGRVLPATFHLIRNEAGDIRIYTAAHVLHIANKYMGFGYSGDFGIHEFETCAVEFFDGAAAIRGGVLTGPFFLSAEVKGVVARENSNPFWDDPDVYLNDVAYFDLALPYDALRDAVLRASLEPFPDRIDTLEMGEGDMVAAAGRYGPDGDPVVALSDEPVSWDVSRGLLFRASTVEGMSGGPLVYSRFKPGSTGRPEDLEHFSLGVITAEWRDGSSAGVYPTMPDTRSQIVPDAPGTENMALPIRW